MDIAAWIISSAALLISVIALVTALRGRRER